MRGAGLESVEQAEIVSDPKKGDYYVARIEREDHKVWLERRNRLDTRSPGGQFGDGCGLRIVREAVDSHNLVSGADGEQDLCRRR